MRKLSKTNRRKGGEGDILFKVEKTDTREKKQSGYWKNKVNLGKNKVNGCFLMNFKVFLEP